MQMQILEITQQPQAAVVDQAVKVLRAGGLVIFPTETTYGAGVDATNPQAVAKLLAYKARREGKPLSIAVTDRAMAELYVELNSSARKVYQRFLPGPVTVVSRGLGQVAPGVESEFGTLGVRIPDYPLVLELVKALGAPITATSANGSGEKRPYTIQAIFDGLSAKQTELIDLVLNAGELPARPPSTVIDTTLSTPVTFRQGEIQLTDSHAGYQLTSRSESETKSIAGRLLLKHWSDIKERGLVITLDGSLGVGKTVFAKGVAEFLHISEPITSPTYSYIEEYPFNRHQVAGTLYHLDVWKVESQATFDRLEITSLLQPNTVVLIEWYSQIKTWLQPFLQTQSVVNIILDPDPVVTNQRQISVHE